MNCPSIVSGGWMCLLVSCSQTCHMDLSNAGVSLIAGVVSGCPGDVHVLLHWTVQLVVDRQSGDGTRVVGHSGRPQLDNGQVLHVLAPRTRFECWFLPV